jgi:hypothetical protein
MAANVKFNFRDSRSRPKSFSYHNTQAAVADVITDIGTFASLYNPLTDLALVSAVINFTDISASFAGATVSNVDEAVSLKVQGGDGYNYGLKLLDVPDAKTVGEAMSMGDADLLAWTALFAGGGTWRVNLRHPTTISALISGTLDK